jgi:hypothetical protein
VTTESVAVPQIGQTRTNWIGKTCAQTLEIPFLFSIKTVERPKVLSSKHHSSSQQTVCLVPVLQPSGHRTLRAPGLTSHLAMFMPSLPVCTSPTKVVGRRERYVWTRPPQPNLEKAATPRTQLKKIFDLRHGGPTVPWRGGVLKIRPRQPRFLLLFRVVAYFSRSAMSMQCSAYMPRRAVSSKPTCSSSMLSNKVIPPNLPFLIRPLTSRAWRASAPPHLRSPRTRRSPAQSPAEPQSVLLADAGRR